MAEKSDRNNKGTPIASRMVDAVRSGMRSFLLGGNDETAWFGPGKPQEPVAPEETKGRQFDYPFAVNLNSAPRNGEAIGFPQLRALADNCDVLRAVIETRKDQICRMEWSIKPIDRDVKPDARCEELTKLLRKPDGEHDFETWLRMLLEDLLVIDAPCAYLRRTNGGQLIGVEPIDGGSISIVLDGFGRRPKPPFPAYQQQLKGLPAVNYSADELVYKPRNPRTNKMYGFSPVEQILLTVQIAIRRALSQFDYFESGTLPDAIAGVPEGWTKDQIKEFQEYFDVLMEFNPKKKRSLRFLAKEMADSYKEVKPPEQKSMYDEWLARVICYVFSVEVTPFVAQVNRATSETNREQSLTEGQQPTLKWVKSFLNGIIRDSFGYEDIEFQWDEEEDIDPKTQAEIDNLYITAGIPGYLEEVRKRLGIDAETTDDANSNPDGAVKPELDPVTGLPVSGSATPAGAPGAAGGNVVAGAAGAGPNVQATALNGTQITSLQGIVQAVIDGQMPPDTARVMIMAAFPTLSKEQVDGMINPTLTFEPKKEELPGFDADGNPVPSDPAVEPATDADGNEKLPKKKPAFSKSMLAPFSITVNLPEIKQPDVIVDVAGTNVHMYNGEGDMVKSLSTVRDDDNDRLASVLSKLAAALDKPAAPPQRITKTITATRSPTTGQLIGTITEEPSDE